MELKSLNIRSCMNLKGNSLHVIIGNDIATPIIWIDILEQFHQKSNHDECNLNKMFLLFIN